MNAYRLLKIVNLVDCNLALDLALVLSHTETQYDWSKQDREMAEGIYKQWDDPGHPFERNTMRCFVNQPKCYFWVREQLRQLCLLEPLSANTSV